MICRHEKNSETYYSWRIHSFVYTILSTFLFNQLYKPEYLKKKYRRALSKEETKPLRPTAATTKFITPRICSLYVTVENKLVERLQKDGETLAKISYKEMINSKTLNSYIEKEEEKTAS